MYRISVTTLEKFRRFMIGASSFDTEENLIESLKGIFIGNDKTKFGGAYHKIIEGEYIKREDAIHVCSDTELFIFNKEQYSPALAYKSIHPLMMHEVNGKTIIDSNYGPIQISARYDGLEGLAVHDVKTRFRGIEVQEYLDSAQWKFYLMMLGLNTFYYDLFEIIGFKELGRTPYKIDPTVKIIAHEPIICFRYPKMENEMISLLNDFLDYINIRNFWSFLKPAIEETQNQNLKF